jgi:hypothetical protein
MNVEEALPKPWEWTKENLILYIRTDPVVLMAQMEYMEFLKTYSTQEETFKRTKRRNDLKALQLKRHQLEMLMSKAKVEAAKRCLGGFTFLKDAIKKAVEDGEEVPTHVRQEHPDLFPSG